MPKTEFRFVFASLILDLLPLISFWAGNGTAVRRSDFLLLLLARVNFVTCCRLSGLIGCDGDMVGSRYDFLLLLSLTPWATLPFQT